MMNEKSKQYIYANEGTEEEFRVRGFRRDFCKYTIFIFLGLVSAGFLYLIGYWNPVKRMKWTHQECSLKDATVLLIVPTHTAQSFISKMKLIELEQAIEECDKTDFLDFDFMHASENYLNYFEHMFLRYYFSQQYDAVYEFSGLDNQVPVQEIKDWSQGISSGSTKLKRLLHGENFINVPIKSCFIIFLHFLVDPFYMFQMFSICLWLSDQYYFFLCAIVAMTLISISLNTYETKKQMKKLYKMVAKTTDVTILQKSSYGFSILCKSSRDLVPGDVIVIPPEGMHFPCDAVLLNGQCVVSESSLTGESFPNTKTAMDSIDTSEENVLSELYSANKHKLHTLYNGTDILHAHSYSSEKRIVAVVMCTGFCTLKGRLIRSIIHPKPIQLTFFRDSMKFVCFLGIAAIIGFAYTLSVLLKHGAPVALIVRKALDVITIAVPPALPAAMSMGLLFALYRLKKHNIYCIDPARVNLCGKLKIFVFDKTGTLTEDTLEVAGVVRVENKTVEPIEYDSCNIQNTSIIKAMACCHSLTLIEDRVVGDPLDTYMFYFTRWTLNEHADAEESQAPIFVSPPSAQNSTIDGGQQTNVDANFKQIAIIKRFPFESSLQRMSVIAQEVNDTHMTVYTKGSPEMIMSMCKKEGIPDNILESLVSFTKTGSRVLAIASKRLEVSVNWYRLKDLQRSDVECHLEFLGLIIFENVLKHVSKEIIETLSNADIRTVMATGDNLYTAVSVAREAAIVKNHQNIISLSLNELNDQKYEIIEYTSTERTEAFVDDGLISLSIQQYNSLNYCLALTGDTYMQVKEKLPDLLPKILLSARVFARMSPDQKTMLIEDLKELGYNVGMCGDGANDCGALKAAHAGIALSNTEASVAAPFTSKVFDISCVPQLIKEGRAALVTSFGIFKMVALYSLIQLTGILLLYSASSVYSDWQFLYVDVFIALPLFAAMIQSKASTTLIRKRPAGRLVHPIFIGGILLQLLTQLLFQVGSYIYVQQMSWYKPPSAFEENKKEELNFTCYENASVVIISFFQYIWVSLIACHGEPYRERVYRNKKYTITFLIITSLTLGMTIYPLPAISSLFKLAEFPSITFNFSLVCLSFGNLYVLYVIEYILLPSCFVKLICDRIQGKREPKSRYKQVLNALKGNQDWPPTK